MKNLLNIQQQAAACLKIGANTISSSAFDASSANAAFNKPENQPSTFSSFYHKDLKVSLASPSQLLPKPESCDKLGFGLHYSDHMMDVDWSANEGWLRPKISPLHEFRLHPGIKALHYAIQLYEGLKAYRGVDNRIRLFRAHKNMDRMRRTAARACLPDFDGEELIKIVQELVRVDKEWIPYSSTSSLYIRIAMIGTDHTLGLASNMNAKLFVLTGPVGAYYPTGFQPVALLADSSYVRAFPGGVGSFKMGCNYAPTFAVAKKASELGCQQVLWIFDEDEKLTEVSERYPTMKEIKKAVAEKRMFQMFGSGTACLISPVSQILYKNQALNKYETINLPSTELEPRLNLMQRFFDTITGIQYGRIAAPDDRWIQMIE